MFAASKTAGVTSGGGPPPSSTDPQFNYVSLLLNDTGTNGAQNNTFLDSSTNNFTITRNGTPTQGSVTPYWPDGQWSNYFAGSQFLTAPSNAAFGFGTGDFTIECWAYFNGVSTQQNFIDLRASTGGTAPILYVTATGNINYSVGGAALISGTSALTANTWVHIALVRSSGNSKIYVNGTQVGSTAADSTNFGTTIAAIGGVFNNTNTFVGYMSNVRIVKGTALYTSNFTPSTTPLTAVSGTSLLTCQSNRFKDNSSNNFAITVTGTPTVQAFDPFSPASSYGVSNGGSGYFSGSGQYLSNTTATVTDFGTGNFTVEYWVYPTTTNSTYQQHVGSATTSTGFGCGMLNTAGTIYATTISTGYDTGVAFARNVWTHIAWVRNGTTLTAYRNGVSIGSFTVSTNFNETGVGIGAQPNGAFITTACYLSNIRVVKGTAVYTANFTPPTAPLTAITNTSLLLNTVNAGIYDNAMMNDLVTVGDAQVSTAVVKYGTGSMKFDGSGDYLNTAETLPYDMGNGNFTAECWAYPVSTQTGGIVRNANSGSFAGFAIAWESSRFKMLCSYSGSSWAVDVLSSSTYSLNTWHHVAMVRNGSTVTLYVNGTSAATGTVSTNSLLGGQALYVGFSRFSSEFFNGYIDDLRITKGYARYTANFTPPTAPFPTR